MSKSDKTIYYFASLLFVLLSILVDLSSKKYSWERTAHIAKQTIDANSSPQSMEVPKKRSDIWFLGPVFALWSLFFLVVSILKKERGWKSLPVVLLLFYILMQFIYV